MVPGILALLLVQFIATGYILNLADALGMEAHEARKALVRDSYRSSGHLPNE
jgi:hypothetical protein